MTLFRETLRDLRWQIVGYGVGLGAFAALYVLIYPAFVDTFADIEFPEAYSAILGASDLSDPRNFFQIEFFSLWMPLLLSIYALISSTAQLAGDEQKGTLELVLAQPLSRGRLFVQRAAGLAGGAVLICALASLGFLVSVPLVDLGGDLVIWELVAAPFAMLPFGFTLIALGLLVGTLTSTRGQAAGLLSAATVAFYLMDVLPDLVDALGPLRYGSPFYYGDTRRLLIEGPVVWHVAVLLAATVVFAALALAAFEAREIGTGRSPLRALLRRERRAAAEA